MQLKTSFILAEISVDHTKFDHLVALLNAETLFFASDFLCTPREENYRALKSWIIFEFEVGKMTTLL